ncbi:transglycosylase SLT domain-containing protein [Xanthobacter autotrophicus DSM 597]|uniref:transglycosylase SLT domain-containing protein n=1 Tax=Xanthobacter TaxID=279 RepID=UPI001AE61002|nr:transglycosylase SLT domain-containing protein [Xanthobacter flavus]MBP2152296.1 soluble lytic murein transglycosylase [Xanthobacter flavus]
MSSVSSLMSVSALALALAWSGAMPAVAESAPTPPAKPSASASKDAKSKDSKAADSKSKDTKSKDAKAKDAKSKDAKSSSPAKPAAAKPATAKNATSKPAAGKPAPVRVAPAPQAAPTVGTSSNIAGGDLAALKVAVSAARNGRAAEAMGAAQQLDDPVARTLVTWLVIRHAPNDLGFNAINEFIQEKPGWPTQSTLRRRAERVLFQENKDPAKAQAFFAEQPPLSGEGKVALARYLVSIGKRQDAAEWVRDAWRNDDLNELFESKIIDEFSGFLTRADHKLRADHFSYKPDTDRALRAAARAGSDIVALTKARMAIARKEANGEKLLGLVPFTLSSDPAYLFAKSQLLRRADKPQEAARALLAGASSDQVLADPDEWWIERRLVARELLDAGDFQTAYKVAATGVPPQADNYRAEQQWTAGWIALRFLKDPSRAAQHFAKVDDDQKHPITLSRAYYWQARAAEAMGDRGRASAAYQAAAKFPATYYGQLSRTKLGMAPVVLRGTPSPSFGARDTFARLEPVKAIRMLYAVGARDIPLTIYYDLAWRMEDSSQLAMLANLAESNNDPRGALVVGKEGLAEGHPLEAEAFPTFGLPNYSPIGDPVDKAAVYAIARQESQFNPAIVSSAKAMGFMQVTPEAGRQVAKITGVAYDERRLMTDQSYNVQFGAAELGELVAQYGGNYVLAFAAYNAGRGSVAKWIARYGDPRDPDVDVVDWVEAIPFSETRNYVQRVMENYQVYKVRFNIPSKLQMEADLRGGR